MCTASFYMKHISSVEWNWLTAAFTLSELEMCTLLIPSKTERSKAEEKPFKSKWYRILTTELHKIKLSKAIFCVRSCVCAHALVFVCEVLFQVNSSLGCDVVYRSIVKTSPQPPKKQSKLKHAIAIMSKPTIKGHSRLFHS